MITELRTTALEYERRALELERVLCATTDEDTVRAIAERMTECANTSLAAYAELRRIARETAWQN